MSDTIVRPTFYEGEILPAADLIATVDSPRSQLARHERYLHRWGIATGLALEGIPSTNPTSLVVHAGVAIDGSGREVVVPDNVTLNPLDFFSAVAVQKDPWYPVFLSGRDEQATGSSMLTGACGSSQPNQINETYDITFGSPGSDQSLDEQTVSGFMDGPSDGVTVDAWRILLGYVKGDPNTKSFVAVSDSDPGSQIRRRYVGVNAEDVVSGSGTLQLATHPAGANNVKTIMALEIHESSDGELVFGKQNPDGTIAPVLTVSSKGDLTVTGKVTGAVTPGSMQVQSGIASDGMILPLPIGIDPVAVSAGKVTLFIHATPHLDQLQPPSGPGSGPFLPFPYECHVDTDTRRIHCRVQWWSFAAAPPTNQTILPAPCDYTVIAAVAAASGSAS